MLRRSFSWFVHQRPPAPPPVLPHAPPIPPDAPPAIRQLHADLLQSPHLDTARLTVAPAVSPDLGPPLPFRSPRGRRRRGGTDAGDSAYDPVQGGPWSWLVIGQVKEGTENRGGIESVVRLVRSTLLKQTPPVPLGPKNRSKNGSEWVLVDAGSFAIHILTKAARENSSLQKTPIMSLNDQSILSQSAKGSNIYPGIANPTPSSNATDPIHANFVADPTTPTLGAGAGPTFDGHRQAQRTLNQTAGVVEHHPGIIESTNIHPLNENSNKDDGWANASRNPAVGPTPERGFVAGATQVVTGAGQMAYGTLMGDQDTKKMGEKNVYGK